MVLLDWSYYPSGLGIRRDEFSWQGSHQNDQHFFLRRDLNDLSLVTDVQVGSLGSDVSAELLSEFLWRTGGIVSKTLTFTNIAYRSNKPDVVASSFDSMVAVAKRALGLLDVSTENSYLRQDGTSWDAVIVLCSPEEPGSFKG